MAATYEPLSVPRRDPTARDALATVARDEGRGRLMVPLSEWVGEELLIAFERVARAYYAVK